MTDEVIGIIGKLNNELMYAEEVIWPDIPFTKATQIVKTEDNVSACFLSDIHAGSKNFLKEKLESLITWLNEGEDAAGIGYLFVAGDLVEGIGVYQGQKDDLELSDIYEQYALLSDYLYMSDNSRSSSY